MIRMIVGNGNRSFLSSSVFSGGPSTYSGIVDIRESAVSPDQYARDIRMMQTAGGLRLAP